MEVGLPTNSKKWDTSRWRIEQPFSSKTLIGNWYEETTKVDHHNSSRQTTVNHNKPHQQIISGNIQRRNFLKRDNRRNDEHSKTSGRNNTIIKSSPGHSEKNSLISWYDQDYRRTPDKPLRSWNRHKLAWVPEWTDSSLPGPSTQLGIRQKKFQKWNQETARAAESTLSSSKSTYHDTFKSFTSDHFPVRYSQPARLANNPNGKVQLISLTKLADLRSGRKQLIMA